MRQTAFRPNNISKKLSNLYYVGASTSPGIGMPICLISAELAYKRIIGDTLRSHTRPAQEVETRIAVTVLSRLLDLGCPDSVPAA